MEPRVTVACVCLGLSLWSASVSAAPPEGCVAAIDDAASTLRTHGSGKDLAAAETLAWAMACTLQGMPSGCRDALRLVDRNEVSQWTSDPEASEATVELTTRRRLAGYGEAATQDGACQAAVTRACRGKEPCPERAEVYPVATTSEPWVCVVVLADERHLERVAARAPTEAEVVAELKRRAPAEARPLLAGKKARGGWQLKKSIRRTSAHEDDWAEHEWILERGLKLHTASAGGGDRVLACAAAREQACRIAKADPCTTGARIELREVAAPRAAP